LTVKAIDLNPPFDSYQPDSTHKIAIVANPGYSIQGASIRLKVQGGEILDFTDPEGFLVIGTCTDSLKFTGDKICVDLVKQEGDIECSEMFVTVTFKVGSDENLTFFREEGNGYFSIGIITDTETDTETNSNTDSAIPSNKVDPYQVGVAAGLYDVDVNISITPVYRSTNILSTDSDINDFWFFGVSAVLIIISIILMIFVGIRVFKRSGYRRV
jgi:hypothetical protein